MSHKNKEFGISSWAVDNRVTVYILTLLIVITGVIAYVTMPREDFQKLSKIKYTFLLFSQEIQLKMSKN